MKPLSTCQRIFGYISVIQIEKDTSKSKKVLSKAFLVGTIGFDLIVMIGSILYFLRFVLIDLETSLSAIFQIAGSLGLLNSLIVTFFTGHKLLTIIKNLEKIYKSSKTF